MSSEWERGYLSAFDDICAWVMRRVQGGDDDIGELFAAMFQDIAVMRQREIQKIREEHGLADSVDGVKERTN